MGLVQSVPSFPSKQTNVFSKKEATTFAQLLERLGFGIAPDIRYSNINLTKHKHAALFRLSGQEARPSDRYHAATILLQLGAAVAVADGKVTLDEERLLETHLEQALDLPVSDRIRLRALLHWLLINPPSLSRMKSRIRTLNASDRELVARFVVIVAGADGHISTEEIRVLNRVYALIGLDTEQLHRDIHSLASAPATGPVTVIRPADANVYRIPSPPSAQKLNAGGVELNRERIEEVMKATHEVSKLLAEIFDGPAELEPDESGPEETDPDSGVLQDLGFAGSLLDNEHNQLVQMLAKSPRWPRSEFNRIASNLGLMPAGAIETINEGAFNCCDEPLLEGDDPIEVNEDALKEMLSAK